MASVVDICNLALAHLGDSATVSSISPPEGSPQAFHCQTFYPIARDSLLEQHNWGFAAKRMSLPLLTSTITEWTYCYGLPADAINFIEVLSSTAQDDYAVGLVPGSSDLSSMGAYVGVPYENAAVVSYQSQPFSVETLQDGTPVLYSDQANAVLRYTALVEDTTLFSPLFITTLSWHLASMLAGPVLKGDVGAAESKRCQQMMQFYLSKATASDANQRKNNLQHSVPWMAGR